MERRISSRSPLQGKPPSKHGLQPHMGNQSRPPLHSAHQTPTGRRREQLFRETPNLFYAPK